MINMVSDGDEIRHMGCLKAMRYMYIHHSWLILYVYHNITRTIIRVMLLYTDYNNITIVTISSLSLVSTQPVWQHHPHQNQHEVGFQHMYMGLTKLMLIRMAMISAMRDGDENMPSSLHHLTAQEAAKGYELMTRNAKNL